MPITNRSGVCLMLLTLPLGYGSEANIKADISFAAIKLVDSAFGQDQPASRSEALEELVARTEEEHAASIAPPGSPSGRPRYFLRVDFHSAVDLQAIANRDAVVFSAFLLLPAGNSALTAAA